MRKQENLANPLKKEETLEDIWSMWVSSYIKEVKKILAQQEMLINYLPNTENTLMRKQGNLANP